MRIRKPLFVVFALLYVVVLPFLVSYALGYDLLAIARGRFVRTGGVFVASTPPPRPLLTRWQGAAPQDAPLRHIASHGGPFRAPRPRRVPPVAAERACPPGGR